MKNRSTNLSQEESPRKKVCSDKNGCGKSKTLSSFYTKGRSENGIVRYESVCKMCKKKRERNKYRAKKKSRQFQKEFSFEVVPGVVVDSFQKEKTLKILRNLVLEALGR